MPDEPAPLLVESREQWRLWLAAHHRDSAGVWVVTWKSRSGRPRVPVEVLVEEAICFGWVDSQARGLDADRTQLRFTPRTATSNWSTSNKERVARLSAAGLMQPAGLAAVAAAQQSGRWSAYADYDTLTEPDDLRAALDTLPAARAAWDGFSASARWQLLRWIGVAKRADTRARRVALTVAEAAEGRRAFGAGRPQD